MCKHVFPSFYLLCTSFSFFVSPIESNISRSIEGGGGIFLFEALMCITTARVWRGHKPGGSGCVVELQDGGFDSLAELKARGRQMSRASRKQAVSPLALQIHCKLSEEISSHVSCVSVRKARRRNGASLRI